MKLIPTVSPLFVIAMSVGAGSAAALVPKKIVVAFGEYTSAGSLNIAKDLWNHQRIDWLPHHARLWRLSQQDCNRSTNE